MKKILLLGSGELGKEFVISAQRKGQHIIACDSYAGAPAMQVADEFEIFDIGNSNENEYADVIITAQTETNGVNDYEGNIIIKGSYTQVNAFICEGFYVREKNTGADDWTYSDAVYQVITHRMDDGNFAFDIFPVKLMATDNGEFYQPTQDIPVEAMMFENTYSFNSENNPEVGDMENLMLWFELLFVSVAAVTATIVCGKKRKESWVGQKEKFINWRNNIAGGDRVFGIALLL